jgi:hypothetical protein
VESAAACEVQSCFNGLFQQAALTSVVPITWRNRRTGTAKLKIKEMGSRYFFICAYIWLEKYFSRGDYRRPSDKCP